MSGLQTILTTAFSPTMLPFTEDAFDLRIERMTIDRVMHALTEEPWVSAIKHLEQAQMLSDLLGIEIELKARRIMLSPGTRLIVAKHCGPVVVGPANRVTPTGGTFQFFEVTNWLSVPALKAA